MNVSRGVIPHVPSFPRSQADGLHVFAPVPSPCHSEELAGRRATKNLSRGRTPTRGLAHDVSDCSPESAFPDQHGKSVCRMCNPHAHNGLPHFDAPLAPSVPASSRHASCGPAHYRGLVPQPPLGNTRRRQACLSAGTEARSSRHWRMPLSPTDASGTGRLNPCASSPALCRAAFRVTPSGVGYPPAAVARGTAVCSGFTPQGAENQPPGTCHGCKRRDAKRRRRRAPRGPLELASDHCPAGALPPECRLGRDRDSPRRPAGPSGLRMTPGDGVSPPVVRASHLPVPVYRRPWHRPRSPRTRGRPRPRTRGRTRGS